MLLHFTTWTHLITFHLSLSEQTSPRWLIEKQFNSWKNNKHSINKFAEHKLRVRLKVADKGEKITKPIADKVWLLWRAQNILWRGGKKKTHQNQLEQIIWYMRIPVENCLWWWRVPNHAREQTNPSDNFPPQIHRNHDKLDGEIFFFLGREHSGVARHIYSG